MGLCLGSSPLKLFSQTPFSKKKKCPNICKSLVQNIINLIKKKQNKKRYRLFRVKYQISAGKEIWTETKKVRNIKISFHKKTKNINISSFWFLLCVFFVFLYLRTLPLENAILLYFTILKSHFIIYTIPFYNISSIPNFYFSILFIKIIYLYNKIIFLQSLDRKSVV